jgi:hypothetical protein
MKLPNVQSATVPERKVTHYLLNPAHPAGGGKAWFFLRFGFSVADWQKLAEALLRHAREMRWWKPNRRRTAGVTLWKDV